MSTHAILVNQTPHLVQVPPFRSTGAKRKTLDVLAEYFCLRTKDVTALVRGCRPNENDLRTVRRTLHLLWKEKLVNRVPYFEEDREHGGITYVYGLSVRGLDAICAKWDLAHGKAFDEHSVRTLDHELGISHFHIAMKDLSDKRGWTLYWQQADLKTAGVHPDALFAVTDPRRPEHENTFYYFLEVERSKIGNFRAGEPSILRKLGNYYEYYNSDRCEKEWNFRTFRVLVIQRTEVRRANLLKALSGKYGHSMFWLTTEELYKQRIGEQIFATPKDFSRAACSFEQF